MSIMAGIQLLLLLSAVVVNAQRPSFAGSRPIGYPELTNRTTTVDPLGDRFGEGTTQRLPIEAQGDKELVDRLSKLPPDQQPFWLLNWQALEANRQIPQSFEQKPNVFAEQFNNNANSGINPGVNSGINPGVNSGINPGVNSGINPGVNSGINPGVNSGINSGVNSGINPGVNSGINPGLNSGLNPGLNSGANTQRQGNLQSRFNTPEQGNTKPYPVYNNQKYDNDYYYGQYGYH